MTEHYVYSDREQIERERCASPEPLSSKQPDSDGKSGAQASDRCECPGPGLDAPQAERRKGHPILLLPGAVDRSGSTEEAS